LSDDVGFVVGSKSVGKVDLSARRRLKTDMELIEIMVFSWGPLLPNKHFAIEMGIRNVEDNLWGISLVETKMLMKLVLLFLDSANKSRDPVL
jgi:hypothetical protein